MTRSAAVLVLAFAASASAFENGDTSALVQNTIKRHQAQQVQDPIEALSEGFMEAMGAAIKEEIATMHKENPVNVGEVPNVQEVQVRSGHSTVTKGEWGPAPAEERRISMRSWVGKIKPGSKTFVFVNANDCVLFYNCSVDPKHEYHLNAGINATDTLPAGSTITFTLLPKLVRAKTGAASFSKMFKPVVQKCPVCGDAPCQLSAFGKNTTIPLQPCPLKPGVHVLLQKTLKDNWYLTSGLELLIMTGFRARLFIKASIDLPDSSPHPLADKNVLSEFVLVEYPESPESAATAQTVDQLDDDEKEMAGR